MGILACGHVTATNVFYSFFFILSRKSGTFFRRNGIYCPVDHFEKGENPMSVPYGTLGDLDDMIFDEDAGGPSER